MNARWLVIAALALLAACSPHPQSHPSVSVAAFGPTASPAATVAPADFGDIQFREIGPAVMGGRLDGVASVPGDETLIYMAHSSGGLYKSTDGGMNFDSIFDAGTSSSIGAIAIAPSDPKTLYVGTGEGFPRNTAALGDGVFVSHDAGKTWRATGLGDSQHIARIAVSPGDPKTLLVAAMGPEFSAGGERGIYRSSDGGRTWTRTLFVNDTTGGSDVIFDPSNPSIAYAGTFDYLRQPWTFRGGGTGSGLWKSTDGGRTWKRLTDASLHDGLPGGIINRVGVALCASQPNVLYAIVPTKHGLLYRSSDAGSTWKLVNGDRDLVFRPFYFSQVRVDPNDPNDVWIISGELKRSKDGGKSFKSVYAGGDNHDLWIDPKNTKRILLGSDMGLSVSLDAGETWDYVNTVPMGQVYRVGYDRDLPYHVMGGFQDHEVWWGPNELWNGSGVTGGSWRNISDWGDGQYAQPSTSDSHLIFEDTHFGDLTLRSLSTGEARYIGPQPIITFGTGAGTFPYRFNWSAPLLVSQRHPGTVYFGGNVLFKTTDDGTTWSVISKDLSQPCDPRWLQPSGGPITHDNTNAETYCTIYALAEGATTLWAGTDDGHLAVSGDGGATWSDVAKNTGAPAGSWVDSIETSRSNDDIAMVTFDRHRFGDTKPYVYVTHDRGSTWTKITNGLPAWAYVVRQDPRQPNLLFAGTEQGVFTSFDAGAHWQPLRLGMPPVPVYDLQIQPDFNDLILGTHGRGFLILDDIGPLESLAAAVKTHVTLFTPQTAWRYAARPYHDIGRSAFVADDKPYGASITYYLRPLPKTKKKPAKKETVQVEILSGGRVIKHLKHPPAKDGLNRVAWDLTTDPPGGPDAKQDPRPYYVFYSVAVDGPEVLPGDYTVRLIARGATLDVPVTVRMDPAVHASAADLKAQYDAMERLARMQERAEFWLAKIAVDKKKLAKRDPALAKQLADRADLLRNGNGSENAGYQFPARPVDQVAYLRHIIATSFAPPTRAQADAMATYERQIDRIGASLQPLLQRAARELPSRTPAPRRTPR